MILKTRSTLSISINMFINVKSFKFLYLSVVFVEALHALYPILGFLKCILAIKVSLPNKNWFIILVIAYNFAYKKLIQLTEKSLLILS